MELDANNYWLPEELWINIINKNLDETIVAWSFVNKHFMCLANELIEAHENPNFFGVKKWEKYGVKINNTKVPLNLWLSFMKANGQAILTLIPRKINGTSVNVKTFDNWLCQIKDVKESNYSNFNSDNLPNDLIKKYKVKKNHWVLLFKDVAEGTRGELYIKQQEIIKNSNYEVPRLIDTIVSIFMHNLETKEFIYSADPVNHKFTYTLVQEKNFFKERIAVGCFCSKGLLISRQTHNGKYDAMGIAYSLRNK